MQRDVEQIAALRKFGVALDNVRHIDLTFWAPSESVAKTLTEACERNGLKTHSVLGPGAAERNQRWLVRATVVASPVWITQKANLVTFLLFADEYGCEYDGWGTAVGEVQQN